MILPADLAKLALQGKKTMACFSIRKPKCPYKPGHDYALQAGGYLDLPPKTLNERLTVTSVAPALAHSLTLRDVRRLGFKTTSDFRDRWNGTDEVWLISFVLGVHTDRPRLLAKRCGTHSGDYVSSPSQALPETAEEVPEGDQKRFAAQGRENLALAHQIPRERLLRAVKEILPEPRNAKDRKQMRTIEHETRRYQVDRATETC